MFIEGYLRVVWENVRDERESQASHDPFIRLLFDKLNPAITKQIHELTLQNVQPYSRHTERPGVQTSFTITANGSLLNTLQSNYMVELIVKCLPLKGRPCF